MGISVFLHGACMRIGYNCMEGQVLIAPTSTTSSCSSVAFYFTVLLINGQRSNKERCTCPMVFLHVWPFFASGCHKKSNPTPSNVSLDKNFQLATYFTMLFILGLVSWFCGSIYPVLLSKLYKMLIPLDIKSRNIV